MVRISVVIPFYNLAAYVRATLDSVVGATSVPGVELEVICVDDGSTDETPELLDTYASTFAHQPPTLKLRVIHKPNGGEGSARNAALAVATGEWVTFLDGDDVWLAPILTAFADVAARHPDAEILGFRFLPFEDGKKPPAAEAPAVPERAFDVRVEIPSEAVLDLGVFPTFFRREKFGGISFSALPLGADRLYVAQCLARADRIVLSSAGVLGYRERAGSMARAVWNERKITSMIDFAAGSLAAFAAGGRRVGRRGASYLADVLLSVAPKQMRRMQGDASGVRAHWRAAVAALDASILSPRQRLLRRWHLMRA